MKDFFDLEGPFFTTVTKLVDIVYVNILFLICCIPVFTMGASLSALYYTMHKVIRHGHGYVTKEFFHAFKEDFKQATLVWLILLIIYGVLGGECYLMYQYALGGQKIGRVYILLMVVIALIACWTFYLFPYIARFSNSTKLILKNAAFFAVGNLHNTVFMALLLFFAVALVFTMPVLILIVPAAYMAFVERIMEKIYLRYMSPEDLQAEEEKNHIYNAK